jgi:hypothetical protein
MALLCALGAVLAGCSRHPAALPPPAPSPPDSPPAATEPAPSAPPPVVPLRPLTPSPSATTAAGFPEGSAVSCAGRPGVDGIVALLRAQGVLDRTTTVSARVGPLCAGTWQYTVLAVPQREPLQVVSQGQPTALVLVTAGTDVCTDRVRAQAPAGIVTAAHCG